MPRRTAPAGCRQARQDRFNEAGAKCPGEQKRDAALRRHLVASMRPGRNAPENVVGRGLRAAASVALQ